MEHISPPKIHSPIYEGAETVGISGKAGCRVSVYATGESGTRLVGQGHVSRWGWGPLKLDDALREHEVITATQFDNGDESEPTWPEHAVKVERVPHESLIYGETFHPPKVVGELFECQQGFWVEELIEGVQINDHITNPQVDPALPTTPYTNAFVGVRDPKGLRENQKVAASQCFPTYEFPQESVLSAEENVRAAPSLNNLDYKPVIIKDVNEDGKDDVSVGTTVLTISNLIIGANVRIFAIDPYSGIETEFGGGIATGTRSKALVEPLTTPNVQAQQWLCENAPKSPPSDPVTLKQIMNLPEIEQPICVGAIEVTVHNTELRADVELQVRPKDQADFETRGAWTASGTTTNVTVGGGVPLQEGDEVRVRQNNPILHSEWTDPIPVTGPQTNPVVGIRNGIPHQALGHFDAFYRGVLTDGKYGPRFRAVMCGAERVVVYIRDPFGEEFEEVELIETKKGYFEGGWDWQHTGWSSLHDIPIGEYTARFVVTGVVASPERVLTFFVALNPQEIRQNIVVATKDFSAHFGCHSPCSDGGPDICCSKKEVGKGLNETDVNKFFSGSPPWDVDCWGAVRIIMAKGLISTMNSGEFEQLGYSTSNMHFETSPVATKDQMKIGDRGYFRNHPYYRDKHPCGGYQGENVIKVSSTDFYGFPGGTKTEKAWIEELIHEYNIPPDDCDKDHPKYESALQNHQTNDIPGLDLNSNMSFDIIWISWDIWSKLMGP
jgi:hypothetical protein